MNFRLNWKIFLFLSFLWFVFTPVAKAYEEGLKGMFILSCIILILFLVLVYSVVIFISWFFPKKKKPDSKDKTKSEKEVIKTQPIQPEEPIVETKKKAPIVLIVLFLILIALIAWGTYSIFKSKPEPKPEPECQIAEDCGIVQECGMTWECRTGKCYQISKECPPNITTNWKTYTITELGLTFRYPPNFYLDDSKTWGNDILLSEEEITFPDIGGTSAPLFIGPLNEQVLKDEIANLIDKTEKTIKVDNRNATRIEGYAIDPYTKQKSGKLILTIIEVSPDRKIRFRGYEEPIGRTIDFNLEEIYNQILSTFKFID